MIGFLTALHIIIATLLILIILAQQENASVTSMFGGMSETTFGGRGSAPIMIKITAVLATLFAITSITLATLSIGSNRAKKINFKATNTIPANKSQQGTPQQGNTQPGNLPIGNQQGN